MKRLFSGIQPSGTIHLGNYLGAIKNWLKLANEYEAIFCIVDYHAITIKYDPGELQKRIFDAFLVNMACGLDPEKCKIFVQSQVPEHTELTWILNTVTPIGWLERMTQFKQKSGQHRENVNMGLMDYPVLQTADILLYKAEAVPVGEDQVQHIELAREIVRAFNRRYGNLFPEPQAKLTQDSRIMGTDGKNKMSKSMDNYIGLLEPREVIWEKLRTAVTDENRKRRSDPGNPDICNLCTLHKAFSDTDEVSEINRNCREASIGCVDCKKTLMENMMKELEPVRQRAEALTGNPEPVYKAMEEGAEYCRSIASATMKEVRQAMGLR
ncbi:MAG: tryptophan--tRNA ligase [bacterium]